MTFEDFIEHAEAEFRKLSGKVEERYCTLRGSHIFNMGEDSKIEESVEAVWEDLLTEVSGGVPMPFPDTTCVSRLFHKNLGRDSFILDRVIEIPISDDERRKLTRAEAPAGSPEEVRVAMARGPVQKLVVIRSQEGDVPVFPWIIFFFGVVNRKLVLMPVPSAYMALKFGSPDFPDELLGHFQSESRAVIKQTAIISHPMNYVVEVSPKLTPREARQVAGGRAVPVRKSSHYVVLDHDGVSRLRRPEAAGTHASPIPHHRRGHWMKLAERCRSARALGRDRAWVKPAFVGDRAFEDSKNRYLVHLDLSPRKEEPSCP